MNMRRSQPPALAVWILRHLGPRKAQEAIAGDLFEKFSEGRSDGWFWREVLVAVIVGAFEQLRARSPEIYAALAATVLYLCSWNLIARAPGFEQLSAWGVGLAWPLSALYDVVFGATPGTVVAILVLMSFFFLHRTFSWVSVVRILLISFPLLAVGKLVWIITGYPTYGAPVFLAVLISTWMSRPLQGSRSEPITP